MNLPWPVRMTLSLLALAISGVLLYLFANGQLELPRRGGWIILGPFLIGLIGFCTSFPYDSNDSGYNF